MSKKILSVLLTLCMLLGMFPMALFASAEDVAPVEETEEITYTEIADAAALANLMATPDMWSGNYKLTGPIDLEGQTQSPIGTSDNPFTGIFDGNG
ncbi:MAG: hypothetical protein IJC81_04970, partial [Clostridia bacterium]|nr:hypothetical protein [Clostridia bacterium]